MYSKSGSMRDAQRVFQKMEDREVVSYSKLITGFAVHGQGSEAIKLLSTMKEEGVKSMQPWRITGRRPEGFWINWNPSVDHSAFMVDLLATPGKLDEAKRLNGSMPLKPHAGIHGSLLKPSRIHIRIELGELAANIALWAWTPKLRKLCFASKHVCLCRNGEMLRRAEKWW